MIGERQMADIKGIVLAGGLGKRLYPLTSVTNKHLLPVYNKPMIYYPMRTLIGAGIKDIMIVTGGNNAGDFLRLLGNGKEFGLKHLNYTYQKGEGGIAQALGLAEHFARGNRIIVVLGDNIIGGDIKRSVLNFIKQKTGARIILKKVNDPNRFGVAQMQQGKIIKIIEKPKCVVSNYAVTGIYMYDNRVFDIIKKLKPSNRGELEITDVNNRYIEWNQMEYDIMKCWWTDAGTFESLLRANRLVANGQKR
jgi:glucose-1-phosphate thymidylyltransferase